MTFRNPTAASRQSGNAEVVKASNRVRVRSEHERANTFKRLTDAKAWAAAVAADFGHGVYVPTGTDRRRTLAQLIGKFIAEYLPASDYADTESSRRSLAGGGITPAM